jgi:glutaredoxin
MDKTVTIYTTPTCHFCQMSKEYFQANNVPYTEYNVASDMEIPSTTSQLTWSSARS